MSRSALGRRVAATAVIGLAATTFSLGAAGTANAVVGTDLDGTVKGVGGAPLQDIDVTVYKASDGSYLDDALTDSSGYYHFENLDFDGDVKIQYDDEATFTVSTPTYYLTRWYGGSAHKAGAATKTLATDVLKTVDFTMTPAAMITGTVAAQDGHALTDGYDLLLVDADDQLYGDYVESATSGTRFRFAVEPGTARLAASGADLGTGGADGVFYLQSWWRSADTMEDATPINVGSGQTVTGIDFRLTNAIANRKAPTIVGSPAVGRAVTASPGTWSRNAATEFSYTWLRGTTVVGTGQTYVPTAADFGSRLNVVVRAVNGTNTGQAASVASDVVRWPADAKGKAKAMSGRKVGFSIKIVSAKQSPVKGKVVVMRGTKVVHKAVKLVKGKAVIVLKNQPKGKQTYTVVYKGNSLLSKATKDFTVRVHS